MTGSPGSTSRTTRTRSKENSEEHSDDSEDDFDNDAKREAASYLAIKRNNAEREAIKQENKRRREDRLQPLKLPPIKVKPDRASIKAGSDDEPAEVGRTRKGKQRYRRDILDGVELRYEGQVVLPYNPLYRLADLPDPGEADNKVKSAAVDALLAASRASKPGARSAMGSIDPLSAATDAIASTAQPMTSTVVDHAKKAAVNMDRSVQERQGDSPTGLDEDYEDEEAVVVPWADSGSSQPIVRTTSLVVDDDVYSEDEAFAEIQPQKGLVTFTSTQSQSQTQSPLEPNWLQTNDGITASRPVLPYAVSDSSVGPLYLGDPSSDPAVPASINRHLKQYQRDGVRFLYDKYRSGYGGVLGDDMGLGKTIQVIAFLSAVMRKTGTSTDHERRKRTMRYEGKDLSPQHWATALILCPTSLVRNWQRELDTWGYFEHAVWRTEDYDETRRGFLGGYFDIIIAPYETARLTIEHLKDLPISVMIADEAHRLKEPTAGVTLAVKKVKCQSCFALTGTLFQNRMDEMWSVLDFVHRGHAGTLHQWRDFANPIKKGHRHEGTAYEVVTGVMRLGVMYEKILPHFYLRRDKRLIASELPEKRDMVVFCPLGDRQIIAYQNLVDSEDVQFVLQRNDPCHCGSGAIRSRCHHSKTSAGETIKDILLKYISAFGKVANHFALIYHAKGDSPEVRRVNSQLYRICTKKDYDAKTHNIIEATLDPKNCGKWVLLESLLRTWRVEDQDNKVLIFSNSVRLLKIIAEFISVSFSGFPFDVLTGEVDGKERMEMVDRFQDRQKDHFVLLISTLAGGVGLNLTAANKVVIFDPDWNPANDLQAMDRAFRLGQKRTVDVYRLIGQGTLEELKYERQIHKQQRSRQLNEGTFEPRIHQGFEGAKNVADQGDLFGIQNIFRFDPEGFVAGNVQLERVRLAEDRFVQDLIEAEYDSQDEDGYESEGRLGHSMARARRERDVLRAQRRTGVDSGENVLEEVMGDSEARRDTAENSVLKALNIQTHQHNVAFKDSPEERKIYELGIKLLQQDPELAKKVKANELGRFKRLIDESGPSSSTPLSGRRRRLEADPDDEPWKDRIQRKQRTGDGKSAALAELSD